MNTAEPTILDTAYTTDRQLCQDVGLVGRRIRCHRRYEGFPEFDGRRPAPPPGWCRPDVAVRRVELDGFNIIDGSYLRYPHSPTSHRSPG